MQTTLKLVVTMTKELGEKLVALSKGKGDGDREPRAIFTQPGVQMTLGVLGNNVLWASGMAALWMVDTEPEANLPDVEAGVTSTGPPGQVAV